MQLMCDFFFSEGPQVTSMALIRIYPLTDKHPHPSQFIPRPPLFF
jgi:hypothetical protein